MNIVEPSVMSPSSMSHTQQTSDKENRESSDSEISSQNSPRVEPPKTPPSPVIYSTSTTRQNQLIHQQQFKSSTQSSNSSFHRGTGNNNYSVYNNRDNNSHGSNSTSSNKGIITNPATNLPYPMLPPGVQVHQSPQSRTTFLYVTSKLPTHPVINGTNGSSSSGPSTRSDSPPPRHFSQIHSTPSTKQISNCNNSTNFKAFGGLLSNGKVPNLPTNESPVQRDKLFMENASLRDKKVLPFLEQFGYGLPKDSIGQQNCAFNFGRKVEYDSRNSERESRQPENFSSLASNSYGRMNGSMKQDYYSRSPPAERISRHSSDSRDRSPEIFEYHQSPIGYTPGGVLALALTRGSKAVMQNGQMGNPMRQMTTPPRSNSGSPELGLDFSSRRSVSPTRNSVASLTPTSTPRSTPGLSESAEDFSDEHQKSDDQEMNNNYVGTKRARSSSSGGGPRKRSSLILEKYAQENPATPSSVPVSTESILSQRLRLSSVIQYAEKCS